MSKKKPAEKKPDEKAPEEVKPPVEAEAKAKDKDKPMERAPKKERTLLECMLSEKEKLAYAKELGESLTKKARAEDTLKSFQTQAKSDIAAMESRINSIADKINTGREYRDVDCVIEWEFKKNKKTWTRTDTGEVFRSERIPEHELQEAIDL